MQHQLTAWYVRQRHRLYRKVINAVQRCHNPKHPHYQCCGALGVKVHAPWRGNLAAFVSYLLTLDGCFDEALVLRRADTAKGYEPGNLVFRPRKKVL